MKIIIANKFYYPRGGDCIYTIELEKLLKSKGHEVAIFSMQHPSNQYSEYNEYFAGQVDFNNRSLKSLISLLVRPFGSPEVRRKFTRLVNDFKPDLVHLNNIHSQLSPVIVHIAHKHGIPAVWTLHDYKLVCPAYLLLSDGKPCEACLDRKWSVVNKKCIKDNLIASFVAYLEGRFWNSGKLNRITAKFISPSNFLKSKMVMGGLDKSKIEVVHNFLSASELPELSNDGGDYYCYIGRLSSEKGIDTLLNAAVSLPEYKLKIIGTGPLENDYMSKNKSEHIEFLGYKTGSELKNLLSGSRFMVIPSTWYENYPLTIIESLCMGTPVLGSDIGGIPELIKPGLNGMLFEAGNVTDLQDKISYLWLHPEKFDSSVIAADAIDSLSSERYYDRIIDIYSSIIDPEYEKGRL